MTKVLPSIFLICVTPLPTTPKLSAEPRASMAGEWGDQRMVVLASFYLMPIDIPELSMTPML